MLHQAFLALISPSPAAPGIDGARDVVRASRLRARVLAAGAAAWLACRSVAAAEPDVNECLAQSDASIEAENAGKLVATRDALRRCAEDSCPAEIRAECRHRLELVQRRISSVLLDIEARGFAREKLALSVDDQPYALPTSGVALELEPGEHRLTLSAPGSKGATQRITLREGEQRRRVLLALPAEDPDPASTPPAHGLGAQRVAALVLAGAGVTAAAVAGIYTGIALHRKSEAEDICRAAACSEAGQRRWARAADAGNVTTVAVVTAGVALASAAALWFTAPASDTHVGVGVGHVLVKGRF